MFDRMDMNKIEQMINTLNFNNDPAFPVIIDQVKEAYLKYRPDLKETVEGIRVPESK